MFYVITSFWYILSHSHSNGLDVRECLHIRELLLKCPCMKVLILWPKILFPASVAAAFFRIYLPLSLWFMLVLNSSFLSSSLLRLTFKFILLGIWFGCSSSLYSKGYRCIIDLCMMFLLGITTFADGSFPSWLPIISITRPTLYVSLGDESFTWTMSPILGSSTDCTLGDFLKNWLLSLRFNR